MTSGFLRQITLLNIINSNKKWNHICLVPFIKWVHFFLNYEFFQLVHVKLVTIISMIMLINMTNI